MSTQKKSKNTQSPALNKGAVMRCFIDEYGLIVEESKAKYTVILQGSYEWSWWWKGWWYEIKSIEPKIPLSRLFSREMLFQNNA